MNKKIRDDKKEKTIAIIIITIMLIIFAALFCLFLEFEKSNSKHDINISTQVRDISIVKNSF